MTVVAQGNLSPASGRIGVQQNGPDSADTLPGPTTTEALEGGDRVSDSSAKKRDPRPSHICPLEDLPEHKQAEIRELVALPKPPPKWLDFGLAQITSRAWVEWYWQRGMFHPGQEGSPRRAPIPLWMRERVYERDGHKCLRCGATENLSLDHIVHWSRGGKDTVENLRTLCRPCNSSRSNKTDAQWIGADL